MPDYDCIHEELLKDYGLQINDLKNRADFKDQRIDDLNSKFDKMNTKLDDINKTLNTIVQASIKDDNRLKEIINRQDNRITALESTQATLKWIIGLLLGSGVINILLYFMK